MSDLIHLDAILRAIPGESPTGEYLYADSVYRQFDQARSRDPDWRLILRVGLDSLENRSKDLQIAANVTEALGWLYGLDGLRQGFNLLGALQDAFWLDLHPLPDGDDYEPRVTPYDFLETVIPPILDIAIPLTAAPGMKNFNRQQFNHPSHEQVEKDERDEAIRRTDVSFHRQLAADLETCRASYEGWKSQLRQLLKISTPTFSATTSLLDDLASCLKSIERIRPFRLPEPIATLPAPAAPPQTKRQSAQEAPRAMPEPDAGVSLPVPQLPAKSERRPLAEEAAQLADEGRISEAIELLDRARQSARCRRDRFIRQLELVEICLRVQQIALARPLVEELAEEQSARKIEEWEDPALCARVLSASLVCLKASGFGSDSTQALEIYQRICRLDPRRALDHERPGM